MRLGLLLLVLIITTGSAFASAVYKNTNGLALGGHDVVAYYGLEPFTPAVKGYPQFQTRYQGAVYYFSNQENLQAFQREPLYYLPQYGGHCAYAAAQGAKVGADPQAWTLVGGKLYLNYNKTVRGLWSEERESYILKADENWPLILARE